ncbi:MAG: hypothetical protein KBC98_00290 [Candidatus Pacebacteria bacterium]|nr:hypothetical protein [Candidatus Paceibacterota bacterium]
MKKLFDYFAILAENFTINAGRTLTILKFVTAEQWDELVEFVKTKFLGRFIDTGITVVLKELPVATVTELLEELEKALKEKGIKLCGYGNGKFYHSNVINWFPDAKIQNILRTMRLLKLPADGMTEGEMIAEAKVLQMIHEHSLIEYIKVTISFVQENYFNKNGTWIIGFLEEKKDGETFCKFHAGLDSDGEFSLRVSPVSSIKWGDDNVLFLSSN